MSAQEAGRRQFGNVTVIWLCTSTPRTCRVEVRWDESLLVEASLSPLHTHVDFSARNPVNPKLRVEGELVFKPEPEELILSRLVYPGGAVHSIQLYPPGPPVPPGGS